jgi:hypothetical protein
MAHWSHEYPIFVARLNRHKRLLWDKAQGCQEMRRRLQTRREITGTAIAE